MPVQTSIDGIAQIDVILRTGLIQGIRELKKRPELLDYCFASLPKDELTASMYGQGTVDRAKEWFIKTQFPVSLNVRIGSPQFPCLTVEIQSEQEAENQLGDVHYQPDETVDADPWQNLTAPFAAGYDVATGYITLPLQVTNAILIFAGMVLVDRSGQVCPIIQTIDENTVAIDPVVADFSVANIRYAQPQNKASLESVEFRGSFGIGCHVQGEPEHIIWLKSIVQFILLRYKQTYLEARGFERTTIQATGLSMDPTWGVENVFTQYVNITGNYRNSWPKAIETRAQGILLSTLIDGPTASPGSIDIDSSQWAMSLDADILAGITPVGPK